MAKIKTDPKGDSKETLTVESLRLHTYDGVDRPEGTVYEAAVGDVESLGAMGMARLVSETPQDAPGKG
jgi:hypothetical protein